MIYKLCYQLELKFGFGINISKLLFTRISCKDKNSHYFKNELKFYQKSLSAMHSV